VVDFEFNIKTYYMTDEILGAYTKENQLYAIEGTTVYDYVDATSANYRDLSFFTKEYTDGMITREKTYRKVHVDGDGSWSVGVLVDNILIYTMAYDEADWVHLPAGIHGKRISFNITSSGHAKIRGISYQYELKKL